MLNPMNQAGRAKACPLALAEERTFEVFKLSDSSVSISELKGCVVYIYALHYNYD